MIDWILWLTIILVILAGITFYYQRENRLRRKRKEQLESDKKIWIAILQSNCTHKGGITHSPFNYQIGKETSITEKEKQHLEEYYRDNGYDWFEFKKR